jgi:hypothetical protein
MRYSDNQIAQMVLVDSGSTPGDAALTLINDPEMVGRLGDQIAAKRVQLEREIADVERTAFESSPEGRRRAALQAEQAAEDRKRLAASARTLLSSEGHGDTSELTDEEALHLAGIDRQAAMMSKAERDAAAEQLAQRVADGAITDDSTLFAEAESIGVDPRSVVSYAREFLGANVGGDSD